MSSNNTQPVTHIEMGAKDPMGGLVFTLALSMVSMATISIYLAQRLAIVVKWKKLPIIRWLILIIYSDSLGFVFFSTLLVHGPGLNTSLTNCTIAVFACLTFYFTTKVLIYIFLVEKVRLVNNGFRPRLKDPLYMFNCFGMLLPYACVYILNYFYRINHITSTGQCRIGMKHESLLPTIIFDVVVNVYLTTLFLVPVVKLPTYKNGVRSPLRTLAIKTFLGSCFTLASSVANLTTVMLFRGEVGWICLMICNADVLFSALVLHAITTDDHQGTQVQEPVSSHSTEKFGSYSDIEKSRSNSCYPTAIHYDDPKFHPDFFVPPQIGDPLQPHTTVSTEIKANKSVWNPIKDHASLWKKSENEKGSKIQPNDILVSVDHEQVVEISPRMSSLNLHHSKSYTSTKSSQAGDRDSMRIEEVSPTRPLIARLPSYNK